MLEKNVLVLNRNYEPIGVCNAKRAVIMLYLGKGEIVERYAEQIHSSTVSMPLPSVIRISIYVHAPHKKTMLNRKNILKRDQFRCQYCGATTAPLTVDHIIPRIRGGKDTWENLVCACVGCNTKKGSRTPDEAKLSLPAMPKKPHHLVFIQQIVGIADPCWKPYLFLN